MKHKINRLIGKFLESYLIAMLIKIFFFKKKILFKGCIVNTSEIDAINYVRVLFGYYESAELRLLNKYFSNDLDFLEIGGGLGILSAYYSKIKKSFYKKIICVEALKKNIKIIKSNFYLNNVQNYYIENKIIVAQDNTYKKFKSNYDFSSSKLITVKKNTKNKNFTHLRYIIKKYRIKNFQCIIDIEGEELNFTKKDFKSFLACKKLIIEIHTINKVKIKNFKNNLKKICGLKFKNKNGHAYYFAK